MKFKEVIERVMRMRTVDDQDATALNVFWLDWVRQGVAIERVRKLHWRAVDETDRIDYVSCGECAEPWPCDTVKALDGP